MNKKTKTKNKRIIEVLFSESPVIKGPLKRRGFYRTGRYIRIEFVRALSVTIKTGT